MPVFLLGSTVDKDELELNNEQEFSIAHKPVILSQYVIVCGTDANIAGPDEAPQNVAASPFGLRCLKRLI